MKLHMVRSLTLQEAVYEELVQAIISGRISPGQRITLEEIARELEVSIMPVREALRKLEARKFIKVEKNRRVVAAELSRANLEQILEVRLILECHAAQKASQVRSEESIAELEEAHFRYTHSNDNVENLLKANREFHSILYREAKLPILDEVISSMWERVTPYFYVYLQSETGRPKDELFELHEGILTGMRRKDPKEVKKWLRRDLTFAAKRIASLLK